MEQMYFPVTRREAERLEVQYSSEANKNARFPSQLRELRKKKGVSQEALAKVLKVSKSTIGLWENGDTLPDAKALYDLSNYFSVSADYILCKTDVRGVDQNVQGICMETGLSEAVVEWLKWDWSQSLNKAYPFRLVHEFNLFFFDEPNEIIDSNNAGISDARKKILEIRKIMEGQKLHDFLKDLHEYSIAVDEVKTICKHVKEAWDKDPDPQSLVFYDLSAALSNAQKECRYKRFECIDHYTKLFDCFAEYKRENIKTLFDEVYEILDIVGCSNYLIDIE